MRVDDPQFHILATRALRKVLSVEQNVPIQAVCDTGVVCCQRQARGTIDVANDPGQFHQGTHRWRPQIHQPMKIYP